jgi:hypothetical protein
MRPDEPLRFTLSSEAEIMTTCKKQRWETAWMVLAVMIPLAMLAFPAGTVADNHPTPGDCWRTGNLPVCTITNYCNNTLPPGVSCADCISCLHVFSNPRLNTCLPCAGSDPNCKMNQHVQYLQGAWCKITVYRLCVECDPMIDLACAPCGWKCEDADFTPPGCHAPRCDAYGYPCPEE